MFIAHTELLLQIIDELWVIFKRRKAFLLNKNALGEGVIEFIIIFFVITLRLYSKFECKF